MYTRFITMALHDLGVLPFEEPFQRFRINGIITRDGGKMSKSKPNVVNPDAYVPEYGADTLRTYLMFMGGYQEGGDFSDADIVGIRRFLERSWRFVLDSEFTEEAPDAALHAFVHAKIKKVTENIEALRYNTAIAAIMELLNGLQGPDGRYREHAVILLQLLAPFAPFITQELWERMDGQGMIGDVTWPEYDHSVIHDEEVEVVVQVNGKVRGRCRVPARAEEEEVVKCALQQEGMQRWVAGKDFRRVVYIPCKVINLVG
jgi:leucyl-tRNA synthetase